MRMTGPDTDPDYLHNSFRRKSADPFNGKKKCAKFDRAEFLAERGFDIFADIGEEAESKMHLIAGGPANTANMRIQLD